MMHITDRLKNKLVNEDRSVLCQGCKDLWYIDNDKNKPYCAMSLNHAHICFITDHSLKRI